MNAHQQVADAIILTRTDYGEADRIITMLTSSQGKLRLIAKGVRRVKSKLAGGVELFSVTNVTYIKGRSEIGTLISARLQVHYGHIVEDIDRTMLGYELIKQLNKVTEDEPELEYFQLLQQAFDALNDLSISIVLIKLWFYAQLLRLGGHTPNLRTDSEGSRLSEGQAYEFSFDESGFSARPSGQYGTDAIKFLRLIFSDNQPVVLSKVQGSSELSQLCTPLLMTLMQLHLRIG